MKLLKHKNIVKNLATASIKGNNTAAENMNNTNTFCIESSHNSDRKS
ncbi:10196_t:CDS:1, partial [Cetraspora pellucida]